MDHFLPMFYDELSGGPSFQDDDTGLMIPTPGNDLMALMGLKAWTCDPFFQSFSQGTQANVKGLAVPIRKGTKLSKVAVPITIAGAGITGAEWGLYDQGYNLLAATGNVGPSLNGLTGWQERDLLSPWVCPATDLYYLAASGYTGTTQPNVAIVTALGTFQVDVYPGGKRRTFYAQAQGSLPAVAIPSGTFTGAPVIVAR